MTIEEFIEARLGEDERQAKAAAEVDGEVWRAVDPFSGTDFDRVEGSGDGAVGYDMHADAAQHVARHDPARVLRQCTMVRNLLEGAELYAHARYPDFEGGYSSAMDDALKFAAAVWSDHPDYRQEWSA